MSSRRVGVVAAVALFALAACGGDRDGPDSDLPAAETTFAGSSSLLDGDDLDPVDESDETGVHAPGLTLEVTATGETSTISSEAYEDITGEDVPRDDDDERPSQVRPADDHTFVVARFETSDPQWEPRHDVPDTKATLMVNGSRAADLFTTEEGERHSGTVVASVPRDAESEDAVIEIETDGAHQSVSVSGERVDTDVPHAYPGPRDVTVESAEELDTSFDEFVKGKTPVQGRVVGGFTTPYLNRDGGDGWSGSGKAYLSVSVDWKTPVHNTYNETDVRLEADGKTFQPINDPSSLVEWFKDDVVFQVPVDLDEVDVVIEAAYKNGPTSDAELIEFDPITATLAIG